MKKKNAGKSASNNSKVTFSPAGDRVLVKPESVEEKTASGIIIPDTARKEKPETGVVVAVGPGKRGDDGKIVPVTVGVGDKVMFSKYGYDEVMIDEEEYYVVSENNILGVFNR
jgi:chaperonin GroES